MTMFKGRMSCKQFMKCDPQSEVSSGGWSGVQVSMLQQNRVAVWVWSLSWQKRKTVLELGEIAVLDLPKKLENTHYMRFLTTFIILQN